MRDDDGNSESCMSFPLVYIHDDGCTTGKSQLCLCSSLFLATSLKGVPGSKKSTGGQIFF
jgi:hypothetical protein